ncbi:MAG: cryptochrome/photolyase family protein [Puniceicoccaceae bacterium]
MSRRRIRNLVVVLGDQLDRKAAWRDDFDPGRDEVWMAEAAAEARHVWSHKQRIAVFLSAMRHFADELREEGVPVCHTKLEDTDPRNTLASLLRNFLDTHTVERVRMVHPGEWRVLDSLRKASDATKVPLEVLPDRHFYATPGEFAEWAGGRKQLRMEFFYRAMRRREGVLMDDNGEPAGGHWNFDAENRETFGRKGPGDVPRPYLPRPDRTTREVLDLVAARFESHPGSLGTFSWPVTPREARQALKDFVGNRLARFGKVQDAMWTGEPFLFHARISAALNLKLLDPREAVRAAEDAYRTGKAPLAAAEGFVRQILGWREYVRGVYWLHMPDYLERNELGAQEDLPGFYWTGDTPMECLRESIGQTLRHAYAHHIQRLMVTGLYALLLGVQPRQVHEWYLAVYTDAVEWVELPNTLGMSQFADGGIMASKPYAATGKYIQRMSNYCAACRFDPASATGENACPFTTLYWDFLARNHAKLETNPRMKLQLRNVDRKPEKELGAVGAAAERIRINGGMPA